MNVRVIADDAAFAALESGWRALHARAGAPVFSGWSWARAWWRAFGNGRPVVSVLGPEDAPLGILPLYCFAGDGAPRLLPIGVGLSDYFDTLLHPEAPCGAATLLLGAALGAYGSAELLEVPPGAALRRVQAPAGWRLGWDSGAPCPVLDLRAGKFEDAIPPLAARKWRMNANRCARAGGNIQHGANPAEVLALLAQFGRARRDDNVLDDPRVRAMLGEATADMTAEAAILRLDGEAAAAILAFREPGRVCFYLSGFEPRFAHESPGSVLLGAMLRAAHVAGVAEAHFLRGGEAYKYAWGAVARANATGALTRDRA